VQAKDFVGNMGAPKLDSSDTTKKAPEPTAPKVLAPLLATTKMSTVVPQVL